MIAGLLEEGVERRRTWWSGHGLRGGAQLATGLSFPSSWSGRRLPSIPGRRTLSWAPALLGFGWAMLRARGDLEGFGRRLGQWSVERAAAGRLPSLEERYTAIRDRLPVRSGPEPGTPRRDRGRRRHRRAAQYLTAPRRAAGRRRHGELRRAGRLIPRCRSTADATSTAALGLTANADLAASCAKVVAAPIPCAAGPMRSARDQLGGTPSVITPHEGSRARSAERPRPRRPAGVGPRGAAPGAASAAEVGALWG